MSKLQVSIGYMGGDSPTTRAPLIVDLVSLPSPGSKPVSIEVLMGRDGTKMLRDFTRTKVLPKSSVSDAKTKSNFRKPYSDPALQSRKVRRQLYRRLYKAGMLDFVTDPNEAVEKVGQFTVIKKSGKLRLVIDARGSIFWFAVPCVSCFCIFYILVQVWKHIKKKFVYVSICILCEAVCFSRH